MIDDTIKLVGKVKLDLLDSNGSLKQTFTKDNLVVATGKSYIASRMISNNTPLVSHMAIGTANVAPSSNNVLLLGEIGRAVINSFNISDNTVTFSSQFGAGVGTGTISEAGIFNSQNTTANTGTMLCRVNFNDINKGASDIIVISWNVTVQ